ncbi:hypothetical protein WV31_10990 [Magnetospirillum sp. ME-1]|uniref:hypothetical protein n=1 Tax=Magnetospirillum sp. ME-1 TaxID=1639348 RepID=UPI000A17D769|nr:hypothetical protein [Magnetospirillum sp. ME-1]ARJ66151.1 hypothetical protein WV31_10990 [Magnetospirillum sp. ME-1]
MTPPPGKKQRTANRRAAEEIHRRMDFLLRKGMTAEEAVRKLVQYLPVLQEIHRTAEDTDLRDLLVRFPRFNAYAATMQILAQGERGKLAVAVPDIPGLPDELGRRLKDLIVTGQALETGIATALEDCGHPQFPNRIDGLLQFLMPWKEDGAAFTEDLEAADLDRAIKTAACTALGPIAQRVHELWAEAEAPYRNSTRRTRTAMSKARLHAATRALAGRFHTACRILVAAGTTEYWPDDGSGDWRFLARAVRPDAPTPPGFVEIWPRLALPEGLPKQVHINISAMFYRGPDGTLWTPEWIGRQPAIEQDGVVFALLIGTPENEDYAGTLRVDVNAPRCTEILADTGDLPKIAWDRSVKESRLLTAAESLEPWLLPSADEILARLAGAS